jgi:exonuclease III
MDNTRHWKIMNWNIRGINSDKKWNALANKIDKSGCDIICL